MARWSAFSWRCLVAFSWFSTCALANAHAEPLRRPCAADDPELARAERELTQIGDAIAALDVAADPKSVLSRIEALTKTRCLRLIDGFSLGAENALSLKTYWEEGGSSFFRSYLELAKPGDHWLWLEPVLRSTLTLETSPASPLRELLCPFGDANCGRETRGWAIRAEHDFKASGAPSSDVPPEERTKDGEPLDCEQVANKVARKDRFAKFRACEGMRRIRRTALPIGAMRAPDHGWLVVEGRRGHYAFCDETRAYELATGSAYRVASCGGLVLQEGGSVDFRATDAQRKSTLEMGHLPVMALREAAWMLLLMDEVDHFVGDSYGVGLPDALPLVVDEDMMEFRLSGMFHSTSGDTQLAWHVDTAKGTLKAGGITWSSERLDDAAAEHAVTLLRIAESGLVEDCPDVPPPASVFRRGATLSASALDADRASLDAAAKAVTDDWHQIAERQRACSRGHAPKGTSATSVRAPASRR